MLQHELYGGLRFDYDYGDTTVIKGINQNGSFFVQNNRLPVTYLAKTFRSSAR